MLSVINVTAFAKPIFENEAEFYEYQNRQQNISKMSQAEKQKIMQELLQDKDVKAETAGRSLDIETIILLQDLKNKGIKNTSLMADYVNYGLMYNVSLSRFRIKDPKFNIYFEVNAIKNMFYTNAIDGLIDFYDELVEKNWVLDDIDTMTKDEQKALYQKLSVLFEWNGKFDDAKEINILLKLARLYLQHPSFMQDYYKAGNNDDTYFIFAKNILSSPSLKVAHLNNRHVVKFMQNVLSDKNSNTDNLAYFVRKVYFDKAPSKKTIQLFNEGKLSSKYPIDYQQLSNLEKELDDRLYIISVFDSNPAYTEDVKQEILFSCNFPMSYRAEVIRNIENNPLILKNNKPKKVLKIFNARKQKEEQLEIQRMMQKMSTPWGLIQLLDEALPNF